MESSAPSGEGHETQPLRVTPEDESLRLTGPAGEVQLIVKHTREVERTEDEPEALHGQGDATTGYGR